MTFLSNYQFSNNFDDGNLPEREQSKNIVVKVKRFELGIRKILSVNLEIVWLAPA